MIAGLAGMGLVRPGLRAAAGAAGPFRGVGGHPLSRRRSNRPGGIDIASFFDMVKMKPDEVREAPCGRRGRVLENARKLRCKAIGWETGTFPGVMPGPH